MHLYLHVPFCARRCSYCDFAIAVRAETPTAQYVASVRAEWARWQGHPAWADDPTVETIYLGGGTPSRLGAEGLASVLDAIAGSRAIAPGAEVTIEANPEDVTAGLARRWRALGVNRVSLGAQSFDPAVLAWMHRTHSAADIPRAVADLRGAGFANLSLDLIFGLGAGQSRSWRADLEQALALAPEHLSLYGLTVEDHTPLARWVAGGRATVAEDDRYAAEFLEADATLGAAGYDHYEVSNYGRPGFRAVHNSAYWRRRNFIGLGPSAHSGFARERRWNIREWVAYRDAVLRGDDPTAGIEQLDDATVALEELYLGLRTTEGVPAGRLASETAGQWQGAGWAARRGDRLVLTAEGWLRLDALVAAAGGMPRGA